MSWLARSLTNSLRVDDDGHRDGDGDDDEENDVVPNRPHDPPTTSSRNYELHSLQQQHQHRQQPPENAVDPEEQAHGRGVKEDLNEIKQTLTRQFWGMASFLAPHSTISHRSSPEHRARSDPDAFVSNQSEPSDQCVSGNEHEVDALDDPAIPRIPRHFSDIDEGSIRRDDPEISGADPNLISLVGNQEPQMEECDIERAVGITEEVFAFATNIAMHPETWLDFPIDEEEDTDDFDMSDAQQEHALAIERLAPRLAALRIELCPCHMSESYFWKVYFVLLHSRLNKQDAETLSTPQVMAARAMWMQELQKQMKPEFELFGRSSAYSRDTALHDNFAPSLLDDAYSDGKPHVTRGYETTTLSMMADYETEKHTVESSETHFIDKSVIEEKLMIKTEDKDLKPGRASQIILQDYEDDDDDWPEEDSELGGYVGTTIPVMNEEDISFSDLEDDDYGIKPVSSNTGSNVL